ncbi:hypothetical protein NE237_015991 [Protea cynaroides]|uniref:CRM domain-containing protein n=1 Tax=Protea cynaroides TaxID=273540 RepID=A0A9Q0KF40_9MAGN|nr:hypothetical protein NE237_015991 [Protea cynaroides]
MTLVPSRQIYPTIFLDSFQTSLSRINSSRFQFFRYGSSIPNKKHNFYVAQNSINPDSIPDKDPKRSHNFVLKNNHNKCSAAQFPSDGAFSGCSWISKWNENHQQKLPKRPQAVVDYRHSEGISSEDDEQSSSSTTTSSSTMGKIVEKLKRFGYVDDMSERKERVPERGSVEDIFYVEEGMLPNTRGGFSSEFLYGVGNGTADDGEVRFPWEKPSVEEQEGRNSVRRRSKTSLAELTLPESELRRLRHLAVRLKQKTKIGGAGITQALVDSIHEKWKTCEVVRFKCEGAPALNMKRMHQILERKTGGLVIWRSGTSISLYRGVGYELPSLQEAKKRMQKTSEIPHKSFGKETSETSSDPRQYGSYNDKLAPQTSLTPTVDEKKDADLLPEKKYEDEVDELLDGLGPRYVDWPGSDPLPVDADLLPGVVPEYKPPFRILPYGVRSTLGTKEATALRRLARVLPPHFAIGRSRQQQGLAMAMVKLWERSSIAKIALKRGVQLTTSERLAEDIKKLTGGTLLSRNKDYIVFYRGKDFLSPDVTEALLERERLAKALQDEEEQARVRASFMVVPSAETTAESGTAGTLGETLEANARWGKRLDDDNKDKALQAAELERHAKLVRKIERKLALAQRKLTSAERALAKVEEFLKPVERPGDPESITDEERFMFRKLGLRMKAFLLLGRRGVFDGTVENMHLHWKYRELVKVIVKAKTFDQVRNIALSLEAESGGVLVSVDAVSKGFAIIVYRGKDYKRPPRLRPKNLLTKRKALARSIELQRREALYNHISALQRSMEKLRSELDQMEIIKSQGDEELYAKLDSAYSTEDEDIEDEGDGELYAKLNSAYSTEDEDTEDEGDEACLETYESDNDGSDNNNAICNFRTETNFPYNEENADADSNDAIQNLNVETDFPYDEQNDEENAEADSNDAIQNVNVETNFPYDEQNGDGADDLSHSQVGKFIISSSQPERSTTRFWVYQGFFLHQSPQSTFESFRVPGNRMYLEVKMNWNVVISPENLDGKGLMLQRAIILRLLEDFSTKKATKDHGYFLALTTLDRIGEGKVRQESGDVLFPVGFSCITFKPFKGEVLQGVVVRVMKPGVFFRCGPIEQVFLSSMKMPDYRFVPGENPFFQNDKQSKIEKDVVVRFMVLGTKWAEADREFQMVVTLEGDFLGPIS